MGIINMTPDSFSGDGLYRRINLRPALRYARKLISDGADILDIGGESTRPGAQRISVKEEIDRVIPLITRLAKKISVPISIDTYKPEVARRALEAGACIVNNIMGTRCDKSLLRMVRDYKAAIVLMHIKGTPRTMQQNIRYGNLMEELFSSLRKSLENCLESGINSDRIILDPGIGFGKTSDHNLEIINRLDRLKRLNKPLLVGSSRKSFIGKILNKEVHDRLWGSAASVCASILNGAHIVRVHDVRPMKDVALVADAIMNKKTS